MAKGHRVLNVRWRCRSDSDSPAKPSGASLPSLPLRASGSIIVDGDGRRLRLRGVNWSGAHQWNQVPMGLDRTPLRSLVRLIRDLGFNFVRLTFALEMIRNNPVIGNLSVAANPALWGLRAMDVFDEVVRALNDEGIMIWLDNHMLDADWCCHEQDCNGLWFNERYSAEDWVSMLADISARYAEVPAVVGVGLKNEPRQVCNGPAWDKGSQCDIGFQNASAGANGCIEAEWASGPEELRYREAVQRAGHAVLRANPRLLVGICGLNYGTDHTGVADNPPDLPAANVVYEVHELQTQQSAPWIYRT